MYQDKTLTCKDCGAEFVFTAGEQEFYAEKGFENEPQRCNDCRKARKQQRGKNTHRESFEAVCAECGAAFTLPFVPRNDSPVYCNDCFKAHRQ